MHFQAAMVSFLEDVMASKGVPLPSEWAFLDGKSALSRVEVLYTLCILIFLCSPGEAAILRQSLFL